ncbi:hypothetical protein JVU11DRAFT_9268 [Chiua virens]|nr:hypothetical protein JVU11DRAFT_9259 [Chiua virens]KAG9310679.1 hypothetical protein JVU11DRAFT_9268 [Chiua virens]
MNPLPSSPITWLLAQSLFSLQAAASLNTGLTGSSRNVGPDPDASTRVRCYASHRLVGTGISKDMMSEAKREVFRSNASQSTGCISQENICKR